MAKGQGLYQVTLPYRAGDRRSRVPLPVMVRFFTVRGVGRGHQSSVSLVVPGLPRVMLERARRASYMTLLLVVGLVGFLAHAPHASANVVSGTYVNSASIDLEFDDCNNNGQVTPDQNGYNWNTANYGLCSLTASSSKLFVHLPTHVDGYRFWVFSRYSLGQGCQNCTGSSFVFTSEWGDTYVKYGQYATSTQMPNGYKTFTDASQLRSEVFQGIDDLEQFANTQWRISSVGSGQAYPGPYYYGVFYTDSDLSYIDTRTELYSFLDTYAPDSGVWQPYNPGDGTVIQTNTNLNTHFISYNVGGGNDAYVTHQDYNFNTWNTESFSTAFKVNGYFGDLGFDISNNAQCWTIGLVEETGSMVYYPNNNYYVSGFNPGYYEFTFHNVPKQNYAGFYLSGSPTCNNENETSSGDVWLGDWSGNFFSVTEDFNFGITLTTDYFLDTSEIVPTIAEKNPTAVRFSIAHRASSTIGYTQGIGIDNTISGTSTATATYTGLADGTYDVLISFGNQGTPITGIRPFPDVYVYGSFTLTNGTVSAVGSPEFYDKMAKLTGKTYETCGLTDLMGCLTNAGIFLFVPEQISMSKFTTLRTQLMERAPFVYVTDVVEAWDALFSGSGQTALVQAETPIGEITFISADMLNAVPFAPFIKQILGYLLWVMLAFTLYRRVTGMFSHNEKAV